MASMKFHRDHSWVSRAKCAGDPPDALFVKGAEQRRIRQRCLGCPVRLECLVDALECEANHGVWGGLTERERRAMLRGYQDIEDWKQWLEESDDELAVQLRAGALTKVMSLIRAESYANNHE